MKNFKNYFLAISLFLSFFIVSVTNSAENSSQLAKNLSGKILIQVESRGEAWYVNPETQKRSFLGRPEDAFRVMREEAVGITSNNLNKIPFSLEHAVDMDSDGDKLSDDFEKAIGTNPNNPDTDGDGFNDYTELISSYDPIKTNRAKLRYDNNFVSRQKGKIFLDVERNGEAWYLNPEDGKRYFLGRPSDAFELMRRKGLGITNNNLNQIMEKEPNYKRVSPGGSLNSSLNYSQDILSCAKNKSFDFTTSAVNPFIPSISTVADVKADIIGLNSDNKCEIKFATIDINYKEDLNGLYNFFASSAAKDGYSKEAIERLYNEPIASLNSDELLYLEENWGIEDSIISLKDYLTTSSSELYNEMLKELQPTKEALPIYEKCTGEPEKILEIVNSRITGDSNFSFSTRMSDSKVYITHGNGLVCELDVIVVKE